MSIRDFSTQSITPEDWIGCDFGKNEIGKFYGIKVQQVPQARQKVKLSKSVTVSDEFREKYDSWLLDFFGMQESIFKPGELLFMNSMNTMVMHPADIARLTDITT